MILAVDAETVLRKPEHKDVDALHGFKNDPHIARLLGGFSRGYSRQDLVRWVDFHNQKQNEMLWIVATAKGDECIGHVGLYEIDHRVRQAEFAILLDTSRWHKGLGTRVARRVVSFGFEQLNLNRIYLSVLEDNSRALGLYERIGFQREGLLRQAQYKDGQYLNVVLMAVLKGELKGGDPGGVESESASG